MGILSKEFLKGVAKELVEAARSLDTGDDCPTYVYRAASLYVWVED